MKYLKNPWTPFKFDNKFIKLPISKGMTYNLTSLYSDWMTSLLKNLTKLQKENEYFFDVGANLGQTLINYATVSKTKNYVGFEPDSDCVVYLKKLIELNNIDNALIVPVGLSEHNQLMKLYSSSPTDCGATFREELRPARKLYSNIVPAFQLDYAVQHLNLKPVTLIKIDVEGWELEVLKGMSDIFQGDRPIIICEVIFRDVEASPKEYRQRNLEILDILRKFEYDIFQLIKTPDLKNIQKLREIKEFFKDVWTIENKDLCDYLFVPKEKRKQILEIH